jgi:hypothetical protein
MRLNRGLLFWGLAFITAGAVALAIRQGIVPSDVLVNAWRLWPVILIAIGLSIIFARTPFAALGLVIGALLLGSFAGALFAAGPGAIADCGRGAAGSATQQRDGTFDGGGSVDLNLNCGDLQLSTVSGNAWRVDTRSVREGTPTIDSDADSLRVTATDQSFFGADAGRQQWTVQLPADPTLSLRIDANAAQSVLDLSSGHLGSLEIDANAGEARLDLSGAQVQGLDLKLNAGSASVVLDESSMVDGSLNANAGSIDVCAPSSLGLQIELDDNVAFGNNLDERDLQRDGNTWRTANYASATRRATLHVGGNAGSFALNPTEGCR